MMRNWRWAAAALAAMLALPAAGKPQPLFAADAPIRLMIRGPLGAVAPAAPKSEKPVDGVLTVDGASPETLLIHMSARGITRRLHNICQFPPLRIEFPAKPGPDSLFKGQDHLKLTTHCRSAESFQQYQLLEYAAYRMYNVLTPASFLVRLAQIDYVGEGGKPLATRLGFFIESAGAMAKRNDAQALKGVSKIAVARLAPRYAVRMALFEYMIGNLDWAANGGPVGTDCCHNVRLIGSGDMASGLIPVPHDFDFSGLVDAPYAVPPDAIPVANVRVRRFRGFCRHNAEVPAAVAELAAKRPAIMAALDQVPELDAKTRAKAAAYLDGFFEKISTGQGIASLTETCT